MKELPKKYDHVISEKKWQQHWFDSGVYAWDENATRDESYVIDTPPPTVSGLLHMGHIFSYTQADFVARYQRMKGKSVFYPMGFDDNGLPTERLVEKVKKVKAAKLGREKFIEECESVAEDARSEFRTLFKSAALSVDWNQEYHTISAESRKISQLSFLDLMRKDRAYRKLQPMLWDPVDQTAIAQAEVEDKEEKSHANYIRFGIVDDTIAPHEMNWESLDKVEIMTTRPELLCACVALMCHPDDADKFAGKKAVTPLFNVVVPIVADDKVDKEKGTGLVMCCTFGDETDIEWWRDHDLDLRVVLNHYGKLRDDMNYSDVPCINVGTANAAYANIAKTKARPNTGNPGGSAREIVVELLKGNITHESEDSNPSKDASEQTARLREAVKDAFIRQEEIVHREPCAERSGAALEILPTHQWFIKILDQKQQLKDKADECNWHPDYMRQRVHQWIDGLSWDWCISRQRYFGVPFPVWYSKRAGEEGKVLLAEPDQLPVNPLVDLPKGYTADEIEPEADVMDTWATSSVSPQLSSKGITDEFAIDINRHKKLFPADLRPQAHEIIRTWAFYTIAKAHLHEDTIPWKNLMISGWCLASDKTKMSKSKGNVVTPVALIEEKGTDAVRYWASTSNLGSDTAFSEDVLKIGKKLVTKLWNATKFAAIQLEHLQGDVTTAKEAIDAGTINHPLDLWIISRLGETIEKATQEFEQYEYGKARAATEDFFWNDFCDNYLEMVKTRAYDEQGANPQGQQSAVHTIYHVVDGFLRLFAPFVPHITEELYSHIFDERYEKTGSIHARGAWPIATNYPVNKAANQQGLLARDILDVVRRVKAEAGVSIKFPVACLSLHPLNTTITQETLHDMLDDIKAVTNSGVIQWASHELPHKIQDDTLSVDVLLEEKAA